MGNTAPRLFFHFLGRNATNDEERLFRVFESIVNKGLLLTLGKQEDIDKFKYRGRDRNEWALWLIQRPRVCFIDHGSADEDDLRRFHKDFGNFGIGFTLETIQSWGAAPVWYIPNDHTDGTQYGKFGEVLSRLIELRNMLDKNSDPDSRDYLSALMFAASHFKGMYGEPQNHLPYTNEKEWRLVAGFPYGEAENLFRELTVQEREELKISNPKWNKPISTEKQQVDQGLPKDPMVNGFRYFNGLSKNHTVAKSIVEIQVPSETLRNNVQQYVHANEALFNKGIIVSRTGPY